MTTTTNELAEKYLNIFPALTKSMASAFAASRVLQKKIGAGNPFGDEEPDFLRNPDSPFFLDLEITTACQLRCGYCARTFLDVSPAHMSVQLVEEILSGLPNLISVNLVGLGEPLLHPDLEAIIRLLKKYKQKVNLVTNAMALDRSTSRQLLDLELDAVTFSLDTICGDLLARHRPGSDIDLITTNIQHFMEEKQKKESNVTANIFAVLQNDTIAGLGQLAQFAACVGIPAVVVSDLNFAANRESSISSQKNRNPIREQLLEQMRKVAAAGVALLGPHILDTPLPGQDWPEAIIRRPEQLLRGTATAHNHCIAPWRTLVVRVNGDVNFCNCKPQKSIGNLQTHGLEKIWYSDTFQQFRTQLFHGPVDSDCSTCPRL